jgi:hypothetical protein
VPAGHLVDVHYESLVADPVRELRQVYDYLELGDFTPAAPAVARYAREMRSYRTNRHTVAPEAAERVRRRWAPYFERYGYAGQNRASASA